MKRLTVENQARELLEKTGRKQSWVANRMNALNPALDMTPVKLSRILTEQRTMTASEFLAFCLATDTDPNDFKEHSYAH